MTKEEYEINKQEKRPELKDTLIDWLDYRNQWMVMVYKRDHANERMRTRHVSDEQIMDTVKRAMPRIAYLLKNKKIKLSRTLRSALSNVNVVNIVNKSNLVFVSCYVTYADRNTLNIIVLTTYYEDGKINPDNARLNEKTPVSVERILVGEAGEAWAMRQWILDNYGKDPEIGGEYAYFNATSRIPPRYKYKESDGQTDKEVKPLKPKMSRQEKLDLTWNRYQSMLARKEAEQMDKEYREYLNSPDSKNNLRMVSERQLREIIRESLMRMFYAC